MSQAKIFIIVIIILIVGVFVLAVTNPVDKTSDNPGQYDEFAQCLDTAGATFYGAFWCPHCQSQKKMFGRSAEFLPYVECSLPNGQGSTQECLDAEIDSYPTWELADGSREFGEISLEVLAEKTGCALPELAQ